MNYNTALCLVCRVEIVQTGASSALPQQGPLWSAQSKQVPKAEEDLEARGG